MSKIFLIKNAHVFAPRDLGVCDVLIAGDKIARIDQGLELPPEIGDVIDADGAWLLPGLVDSLAHISGGGGEGGFASRTPELEPREAFASGVTTLVGVLGTDATTRTLNELYGKARALDAQGLSCYMHSGSYQFPVTTLTGSVRTDIMLVDNIIGVGELAISDHRSSQPSIQELVRVASDARVAGLLSGKSGVVSIHVGGCAGRLQPLFDAVAASDIPISQFYPTHINRDEALLEHGVAFARAGGYIDFTTSTTPEILATGELRASAALKAVLDAGVPADRITFSSDAQGSMTNFCDKGRLQDIEVGSVSSLFGEFQRAVSEENIDFVKALQAVTANPAGVLGLRQKGRIAAGMDADLIVVDPQSFSIRHVMARGEWQYFDGGLRYSGAFAGS
ncbi:beta-aspartyl-peptidase [Microbulbifer marinus]|uniref:Isoaspartyl dipeptidase n=1 Tax=Microbulbifer marinus TaxID=658218 RepID=A0A1H3WI94_9GAMM|nr:beta-aspartyl-peptidase [Microbulbifer marinus]SDZ86835.1 beta-aspartyl-dipeptidase (metallo-type) [Microbulbifer marinus]